MGAILFLLILALLKDHGHGAPQKDIDECSNNSLICGDNSACFNTVGSYYCECLTGFKDFAGATRQCLDIDECAENQHICGEWDICLNQVGSYQCKCPTGFSNYNYRRPHCVDINECMANPQICEDHSICLNTIGSYYCECLPGFTLQPTNIATGQCLDINVCNTEGVCGKGGICHNLNGSYWCLCPAGFTNFGNNQTKCVELNCDQYETQPGQTLPGFYSFVSLLRNNCLVLSNSTLPGTSRQLLTANVLLTLLVNTTDVLHLGVQSNGEVTKLLRTIEMSIRLIAPLLTENVTRIETNHTKAEIMVRRDKNPPEGPVSLTNENTQLDTTWETAVGDYQNYPGFAFVVLLSYKNLDTLKDSFSHQSQQLMSSAVTVSVSNSNTTNLPQPVNLTFNHLQSSDVDPTCVYWSDENGPGEWSGQGCTSVMSNSTHTVCSCNHLSTFALLKGIHQKKESGQLSVVMWVGISVALAFVVLSLIMSLWCRNFSRKRRGGHRLQQDIQLYSK
ncbi:adhesion G protein-coupled receptor E5 [Coregonus clupeaformis]|uniref:adhesion G protein-coupled receptor E5 n=1 Tax=Coregonus clupeaformis TaxID=59861 RepID=UPI001BE01C46|nr:adhesion G protein-coupled receptor E5 [Coregonus clupeaformis]